MSMNMMEILKGQLGGMVAEKLGQSAGLNPAQAESGIGALLPTILGGLMKQSSTSAGADALDQALQGDDYDGGMFDNISDMLTGGGDTSAMSGLGGGVVKMLFGDKIGSILDIVSKVTGMKAGAGGSLLAILAPLVMSFLGKQKRSLGLDSGGMANLLMSQKDEVAKAMPGGMAGALGLTELGFEDTPAAVPAATPQAQPQTPAAGGGMGKLLAIPIIALLGYLGWTAFQGGGPEVPDANGIQEQVGETVDGTMGGLGDVASMGPDDVTGKFKDLFSGYQETLSDVTDEASAKAALPEMESLNEKLGGMAGMMDKLPAGVKSQVTGGLAGMIEPIKAMLDKVMAIPGVGPILKPVVDNMLAKVGMITG